LKEERISPLEIKPWFDHAGARSYKLEGWDKEHFNGWFCLGCIEPFHIGVNMINTIINVLHNFDQSLAPHIMTFYPLNLHSFHVKNTHLSHLPFFSFWECKTT
jgi:hypothetical protein